MKQSVIQRLRQAQIWCERSGAPYEWIRQLCADAAQELESESGSLWCQWSTGRTGHVRMFVAGEFGPRELDSFLEMLKLSRSWMDERPKEPPSVDAVDLQ